MPNPTRRPALPSAIRTGLAALATTGVLVAASTAAEAQTESTADAPITPVSATTSQTTSQTATPTPAEVAAHKAAKIRRQRAARAAKERRRERRLHRRVVHRQHEIDHAYSVALHQMGDPYVYGATGPDAFDCSGLTSYAYHHAGLSLPRTADEQSHFVRHIPRGQMRRGDFVFFSDGGHVYHVGLFVGWSHGQRVILHAPHPGASVEKETIWTDGWFAGTLRLKAPAPSRGVRRG